MAAPDQQLGAYKLIERIGAGGMGEVWKAEDTRLGRIVAVKILPQAVASDAEAIARMRREARTAAQLYHPNIATIHSFEESDGRIFIVMEYVAGEPLTNVIRRGPMREAEVCRIGRGVAEALAEAHDKGIVHRDIKPDNIMVNGNRVKVLDFGIAKRVGLETTTPDSPTGIVTQQGMILGTINYMSPEQALGKSIDARADIFSLGIVLYEAATGQLPFRGETVTETITQIVRDEPTDPIRINVGISPALNSIINRCLRKNRDDRFASAAELAAALDLSSTEEVTAVRPPAAPPTVIERAPVRKTNPWFWAFAVLLLAVVAGAVIVSRRAPAPAPVAAAPAPQPAPVPAKSQEVVVTATETPAPAPVRVVETPAPAPRAEPVQTPAPKPQSDPAAHFHAGQVALGNHDLDTARDEFQAALRDRDKLPIHDLAIAELGLAVANQNRFEAKRLARIINNRVPGDPDLAAIALKYPYIAAALSEPPPRLPHRGRFGRRP